jgi:hypothetical protein
MLAAAQQRADAELRQRGFERVSESRQPVKAREVGTMSGSSTILRRVRK